jgi:high-affinity nickel-transport protein
MTLVDSIDSVLMLYSYAGFPDDGWKLVECTLPVHENTLRAATETEAGRRAANVDAPGGTEPTDVKPRTAEPETGENEDAEAQMSAAVRMKQHLMSNLSVALTAMSIIVAFACASSLLSYAPAHLSHCRSISLVTTMGLVGDNCKRCARAADAPDGGGLEGRWWRFWAAVGFLNLVWRISNERGRQTRIPGTSARGS